MSDDERVNILLVDDQPAKLISYEVILAGLGENLIRANSAIEALEILLKNDIAVILVDVCMPDFDGFELAKMLREHPRYEKTAMIFISAVQISDIDRVRGYESGAVDYVPVPVIPEILRAKVKVFVELFRKTRQLEKLNTELEHRVIERTSALETSAAQLRESEARLRLASEAAEFGTYDYHADTGEVYWSSYLRGLVGLKDDEPLGIEQAMSYIHPEHRDMVHQHILAYAPEAGRRELEFKLIRADGEERWFLDRGQTIVDTQTGGAKWRVMGTILDITDRKLAEERQRMLMAELDHRVKNILSNVSAIARLSSESALSKESFVEALDSRIQAMSKAHGMLRQASWGAIDLAGLVSEALASFRSRTTDNLRISGNTLWIVPELTQSLALILHELVTNAIKYGALSTPHGRVSVSWSRGDSSPGEVRFVWEEQGGPTPEIPMREGFGLRFLQVAAADVGATARCEFRGTGLYYTLVGPLESQRRQLPAHSKENEKIVASPPFAPPTSPCPRRVLVVEDEPLVAMQLQADIEDAGHFVIGPGRSLAQGLKLVEEEIDIALIDLSLGRETSIPIAERLLARRIPFAFATGYADVSALPQHLKQQMRLTKPYASNDVRQIIDQLAAAPSAQASDGTAPS